HQRAWCPRWDDEDYLSLNFGFIARDAEGDPATGTFEVLVLDDGPLFRTDDVFKIDGLEPSVFTETANLRIPEEGSSGTIFSVIEVPDAGTIQDVNVSIEMQHGFIGDLDVFLISPDGTQIELMQWDRNREGSVDGTVSFDDDASTSIDDAGSNIVGTWRPADDNFNMDFLEGRDQSGIWILEISDRLDGDAGLLTSWTLEIQSGVSAVVDEDDLSLARGDTVDGNNDQVTDDNDVITNVALDDDSDPTTVFGNLGVLWGADNENQIVNGGKSAGIGDRALTFVEGDAGTIDRLMDLGLTSNGEALSYVLNASGDVLTASAGSRIIFTVELSELDTGSFKFDLQDVLDHAAGADENDIILNFLYIATDSDGDTGVSTFSVAVDDDLPVIGDAAEDLLVSEGTAGPASGHLGILWGADGTDAATDGATQDTPGGTGNRSVVFAPLADQPTQATTSDGVALEYVLSADDTVLTAYKGAGRLESDKVFEVSLSDDGTGAYTFELLGTIDHVNGQTETWDLDFAYVASDGDADTVDGTFLVTVADGGPTAGTADEVAVSEENLSEGSDPDSASLTKTGALGISWGADDTDAATDGATQDTPGGTGNRSVVFAPLADQPTQATTSDGVALEYVLSADDTVLTAYKGAGRLESDKVFEVSLSDDGTGAYTFELLGTIDHVNGQTETWDLDFAYVAS
ncbi:MAG: proprotein convertase P-domain-containing protein, partial [Pseudomonadota bacterium]